MTDDLIDQVVSLLRTLPIRDNINPGEDLDELRLREAARALLALTPAGTDTEGERLNANVIAAANRVARKMGARFVATPPREPVAADNRICKICDGGPGNGGPCLCGMQVWDTPTPAPPTAAGEPIDMILHCPRCHAQHIDEPEDGFHEGADAQSGAYSLGWANPPHRSHLCHACGCIWRPADVATNGVETIKTKGKIDTDLTAAMTATPPREPVAAEDVIDTTLQPERSPTHRCTVCGAFWMQWSDSWSLCSRECGKCCDNVAMGDQIVPLIISDIFVRKDIPPAAEDKEWPDDAAYDAPLPPVWALDAAAKRAGYADWFAVPATFRTATNRAIIVDARILALTPTPAPPTAAGESKAPAPLLSSKSNILGVKSGQSPATPNQGERYVAREGAAGIWYVWDVSHPADCNHFPMAEIDSKGAADCCHEAWAKRIATALSAAPETKGKVQVARDICADFYKGTMAEKWYRRGDFDQGDHVQIALAAISTLQAEVERLKGLVYSNDWNVDTGQQKTWQDRYNEAFGLFVHSKRRAETTEAQVRELREAFKDETCILRKKRDTVICGQSIVEGYLRQGYVFDWHATDIARLSPKEPSDDLLDR